MPFANKADALEYQRKWKAEHREQVRQANKRYEEEHKEEIAKRKKQYREEHKEEIATKKKEWDEKNKDYKNAKDRERYWCKKKEKLSSLDFPSTSVHNTFSGSSFIEKKQSRQWDEKMKNQSNQEAGCSHWERRENQSPFTSPFKK